jgi:hypothetical protein
VERCDSRAARSTDSQRVGAQNSNAMWWLVTTIPAVGLGVPICKSHRFWRKTQTPPHERCS